MDLNNSNMRNILARAEVVAKVTRICWKHCDPQPDSSDPSQIGSKSSTCVKNCALRYVDGSQYILEFADSQGILKT